MGGNGSGQKPLPAAEVRRMFDAAAAYGAAKAAGDAAECRAILRDLQPPAATLPSDGSSSTANLTKQKRPRPPPAASLPGSDSDDDVVCVSRPLKKGPATPAGRRKAAALSSESGVLARWGYAPKPLSPSEKALVRATLPPIFIPSKGRSRHPNGTIQLLAKAGIPFTVVVEPQDAERYSAWLQDRNCTVAVLDRDDQGVSYARNHILDHLTDDATEWLWIMDDDVSCFRQKHPQENRTVLTCPWAVLQAIQPAAAADSQVALIGLEYDHFLWNSIGPEWTSNSYTNVCVLLRRPLLRQHGLRYRGRVREDYDLSLQCIAAGLKTQRCRRLSFRAPGMGQLRGGMRDFYETQRAAIVAANDVFMETWWPLCELQVKGKEGRPDIRVRWLLVDKLLGLWQYYQKQKPPADQKEPTSAVQEPGPDDSAASVQPPETSA
eukprot:EG_transcript_13380